MSDTPLLELKNLHIDMVSGETRFNVVENVSFSIGVGETFGLVGNPVAENPSLRFPLWGF